MKYNKIIFLGIFIFLSCVLSILWTPFTAVSEEDFGAIIIVHTSRIPDWNQQILDLYGKIKPVKPSLQVAFLGYIGEYTLKNAIRKLRSSEDEKILLIHVTPSSYSYNDEIKSFALSLLPPNTPVTITAMDDDPLAVEILKEYTKDLSENPGKESLMLIGDGPIEELENITSLRCLENIGKEIQRELEFKEIVCMNLRIHSPDIVSEQAIIDLRRAAKRLKKEGRVIVVPYVIQGDFRKDLESFLKGIVPPEDINKQEIISHPKIEEWVKKVINRGMQQPKTFVNKHWTAMEGFKKGKSKDSNTFGITKH